MSFHSQNPYNSEVLKTLPAHSDADVISLIEQSHKAWLSWKDVSFEEKSKLMFAAADLLDQQKKELSLLITREMGKVISESWAEVAKCASVCRYYAQNAEKFLQNEMLSTEQGTAFVQHEALGPVLAVMPWNFPFWQVFRFAAPGLMAGNTGLLKHASNVPQCALAIENIFKEAGFPKGVFTTLMIRASQVQKVIQHPYVMAATLTGSEGAGASVASEAGKHLKKTVLELGGSDPFIVMADVDIDKVAAFAVKSRMINGGQSCIAAKRFIVDAEIYQDFKKAFIQHLDKLVIGDPESEESGYACMATADLAFELYEQVVKSVDAGANIAYGLLKKPEGSFFGPMVLEDIPVHSPAYKEEFFGPVACFFKARDEEDMVRIANDSDFGLGGSVWTSNTEKGIEIAKKVSSGAVYVNRMMASDPAIPFGGIKKSGYGRELARHGIMEFVNQKSIWTAG
ncbi:MAG: NAD-dependent succinate-semialdehyde dehydrogenase [Cyclobacteriaceae bacterium]|nr:NAD-dependent succinate-semialdehyde dehydrogenase [Cyclobacteriaceae bacterium]